MIPDRLAGWWLASAVSTAAVLLISPPSPGDRLREAAAGSACALAAHLEAAVRGTATAADRGASHAAKQELMNAFASTPYRPTGLATADQGPASVVQLLEWCTALVTDATDEHPNLDQAVSPTHPLALAASVLWQAGRPAGRKRLSAARPRPRWTGSARPLRLTTGRRPRTGIMTRSRSSPSTCLPRAGDLHCRPGPCRRRAGRYQARRPRDDRRPALKVYGAQPDKCTPNERRCRAVRVRSG